MLIMWWLAYYHAVILQGIASTWYLHDYMHRRMNWNKSLTPHEQVTRDVTGITRWMKWVTRALFFETLPHIGKQSIVRVVESQSTWESRNRRIMWLVAFPIAVFMHVLPANKTHLERSTACCECLERINSFFFVCNVMGRKTGNVVAGSHKYFGNVQVDGGGGSQKIWSCALVSAYWSF